MDSGNDYNASVSEHIPPDLNPQLPILTNVFALSPRSINAKEVVTEFPSISIEDESVIPLNLHKLSPREQNIDALSPEENEKQKYKTRKKQLPGESEQQKKAKRSANNRRTAKESRERKKLYIHRLEAEVMLYLLIYTGLLSS